MCAANRMESAANAVIQIESDLFHLITNIAGYRHSVLKIYRYLSHITRNERYNWCGFSEGNVLWTLERCIPHVSVGDTPSERFIAICLTPFAILRGRVFPFLRGR